MKSSYQKLEECDKLISNYRSSQPSNSTDAGMAGWEKDARILLSEVFGAEEDWSSMGHERLHYMLIAARERCHRERSNEAISVQINSAFVQSYPFKLVMIAAGLAVAVSLGGTVGAGIVSINIKDSLDKTSTATTKVLEDIQAKKTAFDRATEKQLQSLQNAAPQLKEIRHDLNQLEKSIDAKEVRVKTLETDHEEMVSTISDEVQLGLESTLTQLEDSIELGTEPLEGKLAAITSDTNTRIDSLQAITQDLQQRPQTTIEYTRIDGRESYTPPEGTTTEDWTILVIPASPGLNPDCCNMKFEFKPTNNSSKLGDIQHRGQLDGFAAYAVESPDHTSWNIISYSVIGERTASGKKDREGQLVAIVLIPR